MTTHKSFTVPGGRISTFSTPTSVMLCQLLGAGGQFEGVTFSKTEQEQLLDFYGYDDSIELDAIVALQEGARAKRAQQQSDWDALQDLKDFSLDRRDAERTYGEKWDCKCSDPDEPLPYEPPHGDDGGLALMRAGGHQNAFRRARRDGLRLMAAISPYLENGQDPVRMVLQMLCEAGCDVPNDYDWLWGDEDEDETSVESDE